MPKPKPKPENKTEPTPKTKEDLIHERDQLLQKHHTTIEELYHLNQTGNIDDKEYFLYLKIKNIDFNLKTNYTQPHKTPTTNTDD